MSCKAKTRAGGACGSHPLKGKDLCHAHSEARVGRPSKLTDEVEKQLCDALRAGNHLPVAAAYAGVGRATAYRWLGRADSNERCAAFARNVEKAEADAEIHAVAIIRRTIASGDARLALCYLERRYPERWGKRRVPVSAASSDATGRGELAICDLKEAHEHLRRVRSQQT